jgi:hypothetical protein
MTCKRGDVVLVQFPFSKPFSANPSTAVGVSMAIFLVISSASLVYTPVVARLVCPSRRCTKLMGAP